MQFTKIKRNLLFSYFVIVGIFINLLMTAWYALNKDLSFHTDIGRDFLLFEDIVKNHKLTLIGPRSGGIPGVFHGPLWLYLNVPVFFLSHGNPVAVSWFWIFLTIAMLCIVYFVTKKMFNKETAYLSCLLLSSLFPKVGYALFNPYGALIITPLYFYLFYLYLKTSKPIYLVISLFIIGLIVHFQIAFALPILVFSTVLVFIKILKKKLFLHLLSYLVLIIPLSTYIVFEIRHKFLQTQAILSFITSKANEPGKLKFIPFIIDRLQGIFIGGPNILVNSLWFISVLVLILFIYISVNKKKAESYQLFLYFYFGFWLMTLFFKGVAWYYYYWPFLGLTVMFFCGLQKYVNRKVFIFLYLLIIFLNYFNNIKFIIDSKKEIGISGGSWKFNYQLARDVYNDAPQEYGYFVYSPDLFGYPQKYAMNYTQKKYLSKTASPYQKKTITYLIINPAPSDKPWLTGDWWIKNQVKIKTKPIKTWTYKNNIVVNKYKLNIDEQKVLADPNLVQDLIFR